MAKVKPKYLNKFTVPPGADEGHIYWPAAGLTSIPNIDVKKTYEELRNTFGAQVQEKLGQLMEDEQFYFRIQEDAYVYQLEKASMAEHPNKKEIVEALNELHKDAANLHNHFLKADPITFQFFMEASNILEKEYCAKNNLPEPVISAECLTFPEKFLHDLWVFGVIVGKAKELFQKSNYQRKNYARFSLAQNIKRLLRDYKTNCSIYSGGLWAACMQIILAYCGENISAESILSILSGLEKQGPGLHGDIIIRE
ncbi:MAG: hypothetical protein PHU49_03615 [Syntrophorhabdaceae bacterium]|nr:hypothetical protein [Syntrophorhabdaceae bacterium]MDD5243083.1 hypothetical protein [Syntrophorhabdaceae bacterium]